MWLMWKLVSLPDRLDLSRRVWAIATATMLIAAIVSPPTEPTQVASLPTPVMAESPDVESGSSAPDWSPRPEKKTPLVVTSSVVPAPPLEQAIVEAAPTPVIPSGWSASGDLNPSDWHGQRSDYEQNFNLTGHNRLFRTECKISHFNYDDAILKPGEPGAAHLHMYFGNSLANANSTYETLLNSGDGTCNGGQLNRSAYWVPALLTPEGDALVPSWVSLYYKTASWNGTYGTVHPYPEGLRMISGDAKAKGPQDIHSNLSAVDWSCDYGVRGDGVAEKSATIPRCEHGQANGQNLNSVRARIRFPFCWDGQNKYLDGSAHMSMPVDSFYSTACPASHPVLLPSIEYHFYWDVPQGVDTSTWRLSSDYQHDGTVLPGGTTLHGDWFGGWHRETLEAWVQNCSNVPGSHCSQGLLGTEAHHPALKRLTPHYGPYSRLETRPRAELLSLCPHPIDNPAHCH